MDARSGKRIRAGRLFDQRSGRTIIVAFSHGLLSGPAPGMASLAEMRQTTEALRAADGIMVAPGLVEALEPAFVGRDRPALVVHVDWQGFSRPVLSGPTPSAATLATAEQAAAAGAVAIMSFLYAGFDDPALERDEIERNARLARGCEAAGILHIVEPRSARERQSPADRTDVALGSYLARLAAEIGADLVKVVYPGSQAGLAAVVEGCPAPVLLAGGAEAAEAGRAVTLAREAIAAGCRGLVFGRAIVRAPDPAAMLDALRAIVHG